MSAAKLPNGGEERGETAVFAAGLNNPTFDGVRLAIHYHLLSFIRSTVHVSGGNQFVRLFCLDILICRN